MVCMFRSARACVWVDGVVNLRHFRGECGLHPGHDVVQRVDVGGVASTGLSEVQTLRHTAACHTSQRDGERWRTGRVEEGRVCV